MRRTILIGLLAASAAFAAAQSEKLDYAMLGRIRDEGMNRSQVMDLVSWLSDVCGFARHPARERVDDGKVPRGTCTRSAGRSARAGRWCASRRR